MNTSVELLGEDTSVEVMNSPSSASTIGVANNVSSGAVAISAALSNHDDNSLDVDGSSGDRPQLIPVLILSKDRLYYLKANIGALLRMDVLSCCTY